MESIENDDSEDEDDSGYEPSHLLNQTKWNSHTTIATK